MTIRLTQDYETWGWRILRGTVFNRAVTEDDLNFYVHGLPNEPVPGIHSSYLTIPKFAAVRIDDAKCPGCGSSEGWPTSLNFCTLCGYQLGAA